MSSSNTSSSRAPWSSGDPPEIYRTIGAQLRLYEAGGLARGLRGSEAVTEFREGVAFAPNEMLESYLEDLLNLDVPDEKLFISQPSAGTRSFYLCGLGLCAAVSVGVYAASAGASFVSSFAISVVLALPFAALWHFSPHERLSRRLSFAKLLSQEIFRRRGIDRDGSAGQLGGV